MSFLGSDDREIFGHYRVVTPEHKSELSAWVLCSIGTIFGIYHVRPGSEGTVEDVLRVCHSYGAIRSATAAAAQLPLCMPATK